MLKLLAAFALAAAALVSSAGAARAEVVVKGTGEPAFTSSANNTQWVQWSNNGPYRIEFNHHVNGGAAVVDGPYQVGTTGSTSVNWSGIRGVSLPLQEGSTYTICGFGRWADPTGMYFPDFSTSCGDADRRGLRASTTIDRTAPSIGVALASGAAAVKSAQLPFRINFSDNVAGPFPANFLCVQYGGSATSVCDAGAGYKYVEQPACSQPLTGGRTSNAFECTVDVGSGATPAPDGPVHVCAMAADAAIPDNPTSDDQRGYSTSANRSAPVCDTIVLDRAAPTVAIDVQPGTAVRTGDLVSFAAQATDATSGLSGSYQWTWGDNTPGATGAGATHTFTTPGTFEVAVKTTDAAGNEAIAKRTITVTTPPANPTPTPSPAPTATPTVTPTVTPTATATPTPSTPATPGTPAPVKTVVPAASPTAAPSQPATASLALSAPRQVKLAGKRRLAVTLTTDAPGQATLALVRGGRIVAQGAVALVPGTTAAGLKLPKKAKAGKHALTVVFTPAGGSAVTRSAAVTLVGGKVRAGKVRKARAATTARVAGETGPVIPDGDYDGPRTTTFVVG